VLDGHNAIVLFEKRKKEKPSFFFIHFFSLEQQMVFVISKF
jgi:hypothetical protein